MNSPLAGFVIRPPTAQQIPALLSACSFSDLGVEQSRMIVAFGMPGEVPLGAAIVRPSRGGRVGHFQIFVDPHARRRGIGRQLARHLYQLALDNNAEQLILAELIHEDRPENFFCRAIGMSPQTTLGTYVLNLQRDVLDLCEPIVRRFARSSQLRDVQLVGLDQADPSALARFVAVHYSGVAEHTHAQLAAHIFDSHISTIAMHQNDICGIALVCSKASEQSIFVDLLLASPQFRGGPLTLAMIHRLARAAIANGKSHAVFEADASHDPFATHLALRAGVKPTHHRFRYVISGEAMRRASSGN